MPTICVATILDASRVASLLRLRAAWHGELSAAVLARLGEKLTAQRGFLSASLELESSVATGHKGLALRGETRVLLLENVGYDCPQRFPFNVLRNLAFRACASEFVLSLDVDLSPMPAGAEAYGELQQLVSLGSLQSRHRRAWVLPAFELSPEGEAALGSDGVAALTSRSISKVELAQMVRRRLVAPFYSGSRVSRDATTNLSFSHAYACTNHSRWLAAAPRRMYAVPHCTGHYEPFVVIHRSLYGRGHHAAPFDESFVRGFDKVSHVYALYARNVTLRVAPGMYVLHLPGAGVEPQALLPHATAPTVDVGDSADEIGVRARAAHACTLEPLRDYVRPWAEMPGHTCVDRFLERMARDYGYAPAANEHAALRKWASRWRGKCHTDRAAMAGVAARRRAADSTRAAGGAPMDGRRTGTTPSAPYHDARQQGEEPPAGLGLIGYPQRRPRTLRVWGSYEPPHKLPIPLE